MKTYLFEDRESGELFYVEANDKVEAISLASDWFNDFVLLREASEEEAEIYGYDTY